MNQMDSISPIHEWVEKLEPGDLIRVSYGSNSHYIGIFKSCRKRDNDWLQKDWRKMVNLQALVSTDIILKTEFILQKNG